MRRSKRPLRRGDSGLQAPSRSRNPNSLETLSGSAVSNNLGEFIAISSAAAVKRRRGHSTLWRTTPGLVGQKRCAPRWPRSRATKPSALRRIQRPRLRLSAMGDGSRNHSVPFRRPSARGWHSVGRAAPTLRRTTEAEAPQTSGEASACQPTLLHAPPPSSR